MRTIVRHLFRILILVSGFVISAYAAAQQWEPVTDDAELRPLFTDTVITTELRDGVVATSRYRADGTGEIDAWGGTFPREWRLEDSRVCILIDGDWRCLDVEKNTEADNEYRATDAANGESVLFSVEPDEITSSGSVSPQTGGAGQPSADEIAAKLSDPTAPVMTIGNNLDFVFFDGDLPGASSESSVRYVFQTVFPYKKDDSTTYFFRPAIPVMFNEPAPDGQGGYSSIGTDIADIGFDLSFGKKLPTGWLYGGGLVGTLPTATDDRLGKDKWGLGPEVLVGKLGKWGVVGGLLAHQWDIAGSGDADINLTSLNYFYAFPLGGGWQIASGPSITYDHTKTDDKLTLPLGIGLAKTQIIGGRPWKFQLQYWNYVARSDVFSPRHQLRFSFSPVVTAPWNEGR